MSSVHIVASAAESAIERDLRRELAARGLHLVDSFSEKGEGRWATAILVSVEAERDEAVRLAVTRLVAERRPCVAVLMPDARPESWLRHALAEAAVVDARPGFSPAALDALAAALAHAAAAGRVVAMLNMKGGVGKTVLAANLFAAAHLADSRSIVFVDLDPQHNLTQFFLPPVERNRLRDDGQTVHAAFATRAPHVEPIETLHTMATPLNRARADGQPRFDLVAGDERLFEFTLDLPGRHDRALSLERWTRLIEQLRARYDVVVVDTNPCATFFTRCAVAAADHVVAPVRPERYSLTGLNMLEWVCREIRGRELRPQEFSVVLNGVGDRVRSRPIGDLDAQTRAELAAAPFFGSTLIKAAIPYSGLLRATVDDRYPANPIALTAVMRLAQRSLKESLTAAAAEILARAGA